MPSFAKQFNHTTSTYTCNSNSYSFFDNTGIDKYIRWTMVELSDLFFEDIKNILNETGLVEDIIDDLASILDDINRTVV